MIAWINTCVIAAQQGEEDPASVAATMYDIPRSNKSSGCKIKPPFQLKVQ
jgi:hypothetical protein